jgi:hypothetical protein
MLGHPLRRGIRGLAGSVDFVFALAMVQARRSQVPFTRVAVVTKPQGGPSHG